MAAIPLCTNPLTSLKKRLLDEFEVGSSHLSEALAYSMGFRTHAALITALNTAMLEPENDRPYCLLDSERFLERLNQLGYPIDPKDPEFYFELWYGDEGVISTEPRFADEIRYVSSRERAWRNLMVCAVNAALSQMLFTLRPGDDRFDDTDRAGHLFDFVLPNGLTVKGSVATAGFDELAIHAAVNPKGDSVRFHDAGFRAGDAFGTTWLERRDGAWMQTCLKNFRCSRALVPQLAEMIVKPQGYGDRGRIVM